MYQVNNKTKEIELTRGDTLKVKIDIFINGEEYRGGWVNYSPLFNTK